MFYLRVSETGIYTGEIESANVDSTVKYLVNKYNKSVEVHQFDQWLGDTEKKDHFIRTVNPS
jgi:predicted transcriptional regulator